MKNDKVLSTLSIAAKAGKIISGEMTVEKAVKNGTACLCIVAEDSSDRTKKNFTDKCNYYDVPIIIYGSKDDLGHFIGKEFRASVAVSDEGLAASILKKYNAIKELEQNGGSIDV